MDEDTFHKNLEVLRDKARELGLSCLVYSWDNEKGIGTGFSINAELSDVLVAIKRLVARWKINEDALKETLYE